MPSEQQAVDDVVQDHEYQAPEQNPLDSTTHHQRDAGTVENVVEVASDDSHAPEKASAAFRDSNIAVAVDTSGSTFGIVLREEKNAIRSVLSFIPKDRHAKTVIIPWNDEVARPCGISSIDELESGGGTDPNAILEDPRGRGALQACDFWFLMTDGEIMENLVYAFARGLATHGMHGKACIISIFGEKLDRPRDCNISVGVSVFATSPHVAFLYTDVSSRITYVLSTKGCFSNLLPRGKKNPKLSLETSWEDLPQTTYENLTRIKVPPPQMLGKEEVALQGNTNINFRSLLSQENIDETIIKQILENEDNMRTLAITAKTRGETGKFNSWLDKVDAKLGVNSLNEEEDQYRAGWPEGIFSRGTPKPAGSLRVFYQQDRNGSFRDFDDGPDDLSDPDDLHMGPQTIPMALDDDAARSTRSKTGRMREIVGSACGDAESISCFDGDEEPVQVLPVRTPKTRRRSKHRRNVVVVSPAAGVELLSSPGFLKPTRGSAFFQAKCDVCSSTTSVLTLILTPPSACVETQNFPKPGSFSKLVYPLAMGNYPETDIVTSSLACDACVSQSRRPNNNSTVVLPLVEHNLNRTAWLETINQATEKRFDQTDLPLVWLAIIHTKLERLRLNQGLKQGLNLEYQAALEWEYKMTQSSAQLQAFTGPNSPSDSLGTGGVQDAILRAFREALSIKDRVPLLLHYPLEGFIVANAVLSTSQHKDLLNVQKRERIVLLRFLFHLTESFQRTPDHTGALRHATIKSLLMQDGQGVSIASSSGKRGPKVFLQESVHRLSGYVKATSSIHDDSSISPNDSLLNGKKRSSMSLLSKPQSFYKTSLRLADVAETFLLSAADLGQFKRLGPLFDKIDDWAGHLLVVFLNYLLRLDMTDVGGSDDTRDRFLNIVAVPEIEQELAQPKWLSKKMVEKIIKFLPDHED